MPNTIINSWEKYGKQHLLGKRITKVRYLTSEEAEMLGWRCTSIVLQLEDGTMIFPSADDEGNDAGALFGQSFNGEELTFPVCPKI